MVRDGLVLLEMQFQIEPGVKTTGIASVKDSIVKLFGSQN